MNPRLPMGLVVFLWVTLVLTVANAALRASAGLPLSWWTVLGAFGVGGSAVLLGEHYLAGRKQP